MKHAGTCAYCAVYDVEGAPMQRPTYRPAMNANLRFAAKIALPAIVIALLVTAMTALAGFTLSAQHKSALDTAPMALPPPTCAAGESPELAADGTLSCSRLVLASPPPMTCHSVTIPDVFVPTAPGLHSNLTMCVPNGVDITVIDHRHDLQDSGLRDSAVIDNGTTLSLGTTTIPVSTTMPLVGR